MSSFFNEPFKQNDVSANSGNTNIGATTQMGPNNVTSFPKEMKITSWMLFFISIIFSVLFA